MTLASSRAVPPRMADRLIVALDVPTIAQAEELVARLDGVASFFKVGLWLAFAEGADRLIGGLVRSGKKVFLDTKMFDIPQTVEQGVARAAERGVHFVTVHAEAGMVAAAVKGRGSSALRILAIPALTSMDDAVLAASGYRLTVRELIASRTKQVAEAGCDGIIAAPSDEPDRIRAEAGAPGLLVVTPGIRPTGDAVQDHRRPATPATAIAGGADYLVVGRPIIGKPDPAAAARAIIAEMEQAAAG